MKCVLSALLLFLAGGCLLWHMRYTARSTALVLSGHTHGEQICRSELLLIRVVANPPTP